MKNFEIIVSLLGVLSVLAVLANRYKLPYPVLLVGAGLLIGIVPGVPVIRLHPDVVFLLFLPPLLYDASATVSWHEVKAHRGQISLLAIGLVFFTVGAVACVVHFGLPGFGWPVSFVLGAVLAPPDAVAAAGVTQGLGLPRRLTTILEGESLVNDASALIVFRYALGAVLSGSFVFWEAGLHFVLMGVGSLALGLAVGYAFSWLHQRVADPTVTTVLTLLVPFAAYLLGEHLNLSGVLTVVTAGLFMAWHAHKIYPVQVRLQKSNFWKVLIFVLNGFVFVLIGLQLPALLQARALGAYQWSFLLGYGLLLSAVVLLVRFVWLFAVGYVGFRYRRWRGRRQPRAGRQRKELAVLSWAGMRGVVSMATVLTIPRTLPGGQPFPQHMVLVFFTFFVLVFTLLLQGITLPWLVRRLRLQAPPSKAQAAARNLRQALAQRSLAFIDQTLAAETPAWLVQNLRGAFAGPQAGLEAAVASLDIAPRPTASGTAFQQVLRHHLAVVQAQQTFLVEWRQRGTFAEESIHHLEQELDIVVLALEAQTAALAR
ncbi:cation:proton antiporter [Hymenobacter daeguensis]